MAHLLSAGKLEVQVLVCCIQGPKSPQLPVLRKRSRQERISRAGHQQQQLAQRAPERCPFPGFCSVHIIRPVKRCNFSDTGSEQSAIHSKAS